MPRSDITPRIDMNEAEIALWNEAGSRGDAFRRAIRGRAAERLRETGHLALIENPGGQVVDAVLREGEAADDDLLVP